MELFVNLHRLVIIVSGTPLTCNTPATAPPQTKKTIELRRRLPACLLFFIWVSELSNEIWLAGTCKRYATSGRTFSRKRRRKRIKDTPFSFLPNIRRPKIGKIRRPRTDVMVEKLQWNAEMRGRVKRKDIPIKQEKTTNEKKIEKLDRNVETKQRIKRI